VSACRVVVFGSLVVLRDIGVQISMDDFGIGHSSVSQLRNIPLHELKIDKSFVISMLDDKKNEAIVDSTITLAHSMNLKLVAEGVEDEATLRELSNLGCVQAQGYFMSKPITATEFLSWVKAYKPTLTSERRSGRRAFRAKA
jgi:EAL domain-containing protein (putative c-di-GMP-specific phosphodiesterase class I)